MNYILHTYGVTIKKGSLQMATRTNFNLIRISRALHYMQLLGCVDGQCAYYLVVRPGTMCTSKSKYVLKSILKYLHLQYLPSLGQIAHFVWNHASPIETRLHMMFPYATCESEIKYGWSHSK